MVEDFMVRLLLAIVVFCRCLVLFIWWMTLRRGLNGGADADGTAGGPLKSCLFCFVLLLYSPFLGCRYRIWRSCLLLFEGGVGGKYCVSVGETLFLLPFSDVICLFRLQLKGPSSLLYMKHSQHFVIKVCQYHQTIQLQCAESTNLDITNNPSVRTLYWRITRVRYCQVNGHVPSFRDYLTDIKSRTIGPG
jgi:hypothetical protein